MRPGRMFLERLLVIFNYVVILSQSHRFERWQRDGFSRGARNLRISDRWAGLERERGLKEEYIWIYIYLYKRAHVSVCVQCIQYQRSSAVGGLLLASWYIRRESLILDERRCPARLANQQLYYNVRASFNLRLGIIHNNKCARQPRQSTTLKLQQ